MMLQKVKSKKEKVILSFSCIVFYIPKTNQDTEMLH